MSANLVLDVNGTCTSIPSITEAQVSGNITSFSGAIIGGSVDLINANGYCNLNVNGFTLSGQMRVQVQVADTDTSGSYGDPTSGLQTIQGPFQSGGIVFVNSGGQVGGIWGPQISGQFSTSGFAAYAAFQRTQRYARAIILSGDSFNGLLGTVSFLSANKTTGSGAGFSYQPGSGVINV